MAERRARKTVAANAYRWAYPAIKRMLRHRPAIAADLLQADPATKHFAAFAIRGWELRQGRCEQALRDLAGIIFSQPRSSVLAELWGVEFGGLGVLKRLPGRVLPRRQYDHLVTALRSPQRRRLLAQFPKLSAVEIEAIALFDQPLLGAASVRTIAKIGLESFDYVVAVLQRHRPDLDDGGLGAVLRNLRRAEDLSEWLRDALQCVDLPPPPWQGTDAIIPLGTVAAIRETGVELRNCLCDDDWWLSAVFGQRCFYRVYGRHGPAVVAAAFDLMLDAWRVEAYRGPANLPLKASAERPILEEFAAAGIRFFGNHPRAHALGWSDGFLDVP